MIFDAFTGLALLLGMQAANAENRLDSHAHLSALEVRSHQQWMEGELAELSRLMVPEFRLVVMNGNVERREDVVGTPGIDREPSPLSVRSLAVQPDDIIVRDDTAIVISTMNIDASVRGRPLNPLMRVLSVYTRREGGWSLQARSITPVLRPQPGS
jgi:hypothetical protein